MNTPLRVTLLSALFILPFSACSESLESSTANGEERSSAPRPGAKADGEQIASSDRCEELSLYGDGICDTECPLPDSDCEPVESTPDESESRSELDEDDLNWLCEPEEAELNGICLPVCGDRDPDCAIESEEPPEDPCSGGFDDTDGICNEQCFPEDDDCRLLNDACYEELRYGDRQCDQDCAFPDPDCEWEPPISGLLSEEEQQICSRLPNGSLRRDLATSLCMERSAADQPACIAACVRA